MPKSAEVKKGIRIIGGSLRGRCIQSVRGWKIRPTSNRLRESVFNILGPDVSGSIVLDLFAGTGALGIEALSRGAEKAVFIDDARTSVKTIAANITACGLLDRSTVIQWNIIQNLKCLHHSNSTFDLVFMDPPYGRQAVLPALTNLSKSGTLKRNSHVVVEHRKHDAIPPECPVFTVADRRKYGKSLVSFLQYMV